MSIAIVTGSAGLVGSAAATLFAERGFDIVGIDNDMRAYFFGPQASTSWNTQQLHQRLGKAYRHHAIDIRDAEAINRLFEQLGRDIGAVIHTAAQPSHDWAASEPATDFSVNANGTLNLLEATRRHCPTAPFVFTSTNKVYGDTPNLLPLVETETRWELDPSHAYHARGIDESMSIDQTRHSLFGVSKVAADVMVQEYGRYFDMPTVSFRGGCLTGPSHSGAQMHGFLAYLMRCALTGTPYTVLGYKGKQVRDNIHAADLVEAFWHYVQAPRPGQVYNMGGGRRSNISMREAIAACQELTSRPMNWSYQDQARIGDHIWYISDTSLFESHYPGWRPRHDMASTLAEIHDGLKKRL
ncbi:NAD-dependent epimerase/dehydratase family protein [Magnetospirillum sp. 64-120]|uniref:NAD-dependent epimerase/dehydratase family protein n=1 Tax=Magnetospirillum sp. 64-120 TaxID=1895778 RepID=UPI00092A0884|nr:NAD-dependent epimerase/dehydratase family protein [Magnetospirillum sp. 64-120]OJX70338.1 MAG: NAD-dependent epimerase [Magnetospirillum sp. 64-120]